MVSTKAYPQDTYLVSSTISILLKVFCNASVAFLGSKICFWKVPLLGQLEHSEDFVKSSFICLLTIQAYCTERSKSTNFVDYTCHADDKKRTTVRILCFTLSSNASQTALLLFIIFLTRQIIIWKKNLNLSILKVCIVHTNTWI